MSKYPIGKLVKKEFDEKLLEGLFSQTMMIFMCIARLG